MKNNKAFTLVEIMVAIAIVGILAGVVMVSISSYADRARSTAALQTASSVMPAAMKCVLEGKSISPTGSSYAKPTAGNSICDGSSFTWPALGTSSTSGWEYKAAGYLTDGDFYYLIGPPNQTLTSGNKLILCSLTYKGVWSGSGGLWPTALPGTCTIQTYP